MPRLYAMSTITCKLCKFIDKNRKVKWGNEYCFANTVSFLLKTEESDMKFLACF